MNFRDRLLSIAHKIYLPSSGKKLGLSDDIEGLDTLVPPVLRFSPADKPSEYCDEWAHFRVT